MRMRGSDEASRPEAEPAAAVTGGRCARALTRVMCSDSNTHCVDRVSDRDVKLAVESVTQRQPCICHLCTVPLRPITTTNP